MNGQQLGRYVLERRLASGGMAEIWLAKQAGPAGFQKDVVVKRILPHLASDQRFVEMFLDEARLAAQLDHPNIVQIFDLGQAGTDFFIAMEFVDGWDLEAIIERALAVGLTLHPAICARIIADSCTGLDYAHRFTDREGHPAGLVHRDVSPQNIRVSRNGAVKVMDFGIAKARNSSHKTQTGAVKGKLSYMSPEQIMAQDLDGRSDIFALGIVLYEMLTLQRPFGHESELLAISAIINQQPRSLSELSPHVPGELEQIVLRSLAKDRGQRFQSGADLQMALEQYLRSEGLLLTPRDVAEYLADLFSERPTGRIAALERSNYGGPSVGDPRAPGAGTPRPGGPTRVNHAGGMNTITQVPFDTPPPPPRSKTGLYVVLALLFLVVIGAGGALFALVILPGLGTPVAEGSGISADGSSTAMAEADAGPDVAAVAAVDVVVPAAPDVVIPPLPDVAVLPPLEGTGAPLNGTGAPLEGTAAPLNGTGAPLEGTAAPLEGTAVAVVVDAGAVVPEPVDAGATDVRAATDTARRPPPAATGSLGLNLNAPAEVFIDGRSRGEHAGQASFTGLSPGSHRVEAVNSSGVTRTITVNIVAGERTVERIRF
jgi:serine/threonine protein kinase